MLRTEPANTRRPKLHRLRRLRRSPTPGTRTTPCRDAHRLRFGARRPAPGRAYRCACGVRCAPVTGGGGGVRSIRWWLADTCEPGSASASRGVRFSQAQFPSETVRRVREIRSRAQASNAETAAAMSVSTTRIPTCDAARRAVVGRRGSCRPMIAQARSPTRRRCAVGGDRGRER